MCFNEARGHISELYQYLFYIPAPHLVWLTCGCCVLTGADLSDYFNYGFNEDTWKAYCEKQKRLRMGLEVSSVGSVASKITVSFHHPGLFTV